MVAILPSSKLDRIKRDEIATFQIKERRKEISKAEEKKQVSERTVDLSCFLLVSRVLLGNINDWKGLEDYMMSKSPEALIANLTESSQSVFHMIASSAAPTWLLKKLLSRVSPESLQKMTDEDGWSPIFYAAATGNAKFVKIFVRMNEVLPNTRDNLHSLPIHEAAKRGRRETVQYLLQVTTLTLDGADVLTLIKHLISSDLFDIALHLLKKYPKIARGAPDDTESVLELLAKRRKAFASARRLGFWERVLYQWIPLPEEYNPHPQPLPENVDRDPENQLMATSNILFTKFLITQLATAIGFILQKLKIVTWNTLMQLAPSIKCIRDEKLTHMQTLEIVRIMCARAADTWTKLWEAEKSLNKPMCTAARGEGGGGGGGVCEIVKEIIETYFHSIYFVDENEDDVLNIAIRNRQEKVFNILYYQLKEWKSAMANFDSENNNTLHLAGMLVPSSEIPGAALQMQRELQWFKAVESFCHSSLQDQLNTDKKTPREVFTEQHNKLVEKGERWMKDTAQSCSVVAALIITIAFAAAFTVPGGSNDRGIPNYLHELCFKIFGISDALALFSSTASVLMFLGILTSRYSEDDFLVSLPKKLIIGLVTLFFSIASLMVAFSATVYLVIFHPWKWVIIPTALLGFLPVTLFVTLQFPLLVEMYSSTYGPGIIQPIK